MLSDCASFSLGKQLCCDLEPYEELDLAKKKLAETTEAKDIYRLYSFFSLETIIYVLLGSTLNIFESILKS